MILIGRYYHRFAVLQIIYYTLLRYAVETNFNVIRNPNINFHLNIDNLNEPNNIIYMFRFFIHFISNRLCR